MHPLIEELVQASPILVDGAWGTELQSRGLPSGEVPDGWNLSQPSLVAEVPLAYANAGSRIVLTNSFRGNRIALTAAGLGEQVVEVNRRAAAISKEAVGGRALVFGSVGPSGKMLCVGEVSAEELETAFWEQVSALKEGGVDGLVIETMSDLEEARIATLAAKATSLPVVACMCFDSGPNKDRTMMGVTPEQAVEALQAAGADVLGANCGQGIEGYIPLATRFLNATQLPVWIKANAGIPKLVDGQAVYDTTPEQFAAAAKKLLETGVTFVGGCCGTNPDFIAAIERALST